MKALNKFLAMTLPFLMMSGPPGFHSEEFESGYKPQDKPLKKKHRGKKLPRSKRK
jgi:hypothetical protein